jgi:hypothetical protein
LKEKAEAEIQDEYSSEYDGSLSNIKYIGSYFAKNDYDYNCYMYAIYTATLTSSDGDFEPTTVYLPVQLKYLIIDGNGDLILDNIYAYMKGSFNIDGTWNYFDGYDDPYEMYENLVYNGYKHVSIASFGEEIYKRTITVSGLAKSYAMTGWRIGYTGSSEEIAKLMGSVQSHQTSNPNSIAQKAAVEALRGDQSTVKMMLGEFDKR